MKASIAHHNFTNERQLEHAIAGVQEAFNAIVSLYNETRLFPNGLPAELLQAMDWLHQERMRLEAIAENWY